jgi:hypothetical protein
MKNKLARGVEWNGIEQLRFIQLIAWSRSTVYSLVASVPDAEDNNAQLRTWERARLSLSIKDRCMNVRMK